MSTQVGFIGRQAELQILDERLAVAETGRPQVVSVEGEAGAGKSSLTFAISRLDEERRRPRSRWRRRRDVALLWSHRSVTAGGRHRLGEATSAVNKMRTHMLDLVILPAHDPTAAGRLAHATGQPPALAG